MVINSEEDHGMAKVNFARLGHTCAYLLDDSYVSVTRTNESLI